MEVTLALDRSQLLRLARHGAVARVKELRDEIASLVKTFPDLRRSLGRPRSAAKARRKRGVKALATGSQAPATANEQSSRRRGWTAAQRKAAAARMRRYWRERKAGRKQ